MNGRPEHVPDHWGSASVEELTEFVTSGSRGWAKHYADDGPLFLRVGNLNHNTVGIDLSDAAHVRPPEGAEGERTRVQPGDILLSITAEVGMVGLAPKRLPEAYVNQHVALVRPRSTVWAPGLAYAFLDPQGLQALAKKSQYGATKPGLSLIQVRSFQVGVPPIPEQHRIVEAIESYFTRLDDAVATLERVRRNLKRYRASVLKAAVEGRLVPTEAELARAEGRASEPASMLLERILAERRRRWQEAGGRGKYEEPAARDVTDLPELPEGWCWATVDQLSHEVRYGSSAKAHEEQDGGVPVVRMGNIVDGFLDFTDLKYLPASHDEFPDLLLQPGDLLFNRTNSAELVGKTAVFRGRGEPCSFASYLIRVRMLRGAHPDFVSYYINSLAGRAWIASVVSQQVGQANVNGTKLRACAVPLPPNNEQHRIVGEVDRLLSVAFAAAQAAAADHQRCQRLRQSILQWAFEGRLADQDPSDEPASVLLERIRTETAARVSSAPTDARRSDGGRRVQ